MQLAPAELMRYYGPQLQIGKYVVFGRGMEGRQVKKGEPEKEVRLTESAIERVVSWCSARAKIKYGDALVMRFGSVPLGMDNSPVLNVDVCLYNPQQSSWH
jgi:hypothetical protein